MTQPITERAGMIDYHGPIPYKNRLTEEDFMQADYFEGYRHLKRSRDDKGVLIAEIHSNVPADSGSDASNTRIHFIQPLKERIVREVGYGLSIEEASSAALVKSKQAKSESLTQR